MSDRRKRGVFTTWRVFGPFVSFRFVCRRVAAGSTTLPILEEAATATSTGVAAAAAAASAATPAAARGVSSSPPSAVAGGAGGGEGGRRDSGSGRGHLSETEEVSVETCHVGKRMTLSYQ